MSDDRDVVGDRAVPWERADGPAWGPIEWSGPGADFSSTTKLATWLLEQTADGELPDVHLRECQTLKPPPPGAPAIFGDRLTCNCGMPSRWLAECDAKRRIIEEFKVAEQRIGHAAQHAPDQLPALAGARNALDDVLHLLALPLADRPGYREEWRPDTPTGPTLA